MYSARSSVRRCDAEALQVLLREVDASAARILADVADDVGQLECDAQVARIAPGRRIGVTEDLGRHETHDTCDAVAIELECREVEIAMLGQVHRHAVDHRLEMRLRQVELADHRRKRERDGVLGRTVEGECRPRAATRRASRWPRRDR